MRQLFALLCLITVLFSLPAIAQAATCDQSQHEWVPTRYYHPGELVHYNDQWYRSRELHEGHQPGRGEFAWEAVSETPDCEARAANAKPETAAAQPRSDAPAKDSPETSNEQAPAGGVSSMTADTVCQDSPQWVFSKAYEVGTTVRHEGHLYKAIRPSNGDMPGVAMPPHWRKLETDCAGQ
ncbi:hypothetical protein [Marinobacter sp. BGYM27]|uniref:hypothetical protein n=1 Tax=Marinobacter sp. BGYM27 TaxID=2975597 RepID=UPI0021A796C9|nr:hypothetical protein [Marinobacter sp. BGYM27]MDG5501194.1 hypothetical protein [Marinobacter sp. BGYM27]